MANLPKKVAIYARVSTSDQQTISLQLDSMKSYLKERGWLLVKEVAEIQSGAVLRPKRDSLLKEVANLTTELNHSKITREHHEPVKEQPHKVSKIAKEAEVDSLALNSHKASGPCMEKKM